MAEIENQGRHDGEGFREIAGDLWSNKPLLIGLAVVLFVVIYLIAKNKSSALTAPTSSTPTTSQSGAASGNYLIVNDEPVPNVNVTVNAPTSSTSPPPKPPTGIFPPKPPTPTPIPVPKPPTPTPAPAGKYVHPAAFPAPTSTLFGIAAANGKTLAQIQALNQWIYQQRNSWNLIYPSDSIRVS